MAQQRRDPKKESFWQRMIGRQARSGMTVRAWCLAQQVSEATFHWWKRELARRDGELEKSTATKRRHRHAASSPAFVPVRVSPTDPRVSPTDSCVHPNDPREGGSQIEIVLVDGRCVRVAGPVDRQMLADVLAALEPPAC